MGRRDRDMVENQISGAANHGKEGYHQQKGTCDETPTLGISGPGELYWEESP